MEVNEKCPTCGRKDCFGNEEGYCLVLTENNFGNRSCPFYKTEEKVAEEKEYVKNRLAELIEQKLEG